MQMHNAPSHGPPLTQYQSTKNALYHSHKNTRMYRSPVGLVHSMQTKHNINLHRIISNHRAWFWNTSIPKTQRGCPIVSPFMWRWLCVVVCVCVCVCAYARVALLWYLVRGRPFSSLTKLFGTPRRRNIMAFGLKATVDRACARLCTQLTWTLWACTIWFAYKNQHLCIAAGLCQFCVGPIWQMKGPQTCARTDRERESERRVENVNASSVC